MDRLRGCALGITKPHVTTGHGSQMCGYARGQAVKTLATLALDHQWLAPGQARSHLPCLPKLPHEEIGGGV